MQSAEQRIREMDVKIAIRAAALELAVFQIKRFLLAVILFAIIAGMMAANS